MKHRHPKHFRVSFFISDWTAYVDYYFFYRNNN